MECLSAAASTSLKNGQTPNPRHSQLQYVLCMHDKKKEYQIPHITASFFTIIKAGSNVWNQHFSIVLGLQYLSPSLLIVMVCVPTMSRDCPENHLGSVCNELPQEAEKLEALAQDGWSSSIETNSQSAKWTERKAGFEAPLQMEEVAAKSLARTGESAK
ncbi:hypothetical protein H257_03566 [Aphanomyces astaci]|uniref:Uncharacterized protein n=1 Tax=Aphanomyces astaci TaxID=112090 RepID=W4GYB9_APHAT|nr:hypothetical protein H257_03566 [Aphanomyces astaci]ETV84326.1 hypothetical protein H257_03566 [Aphanomyces astaci]|eukprot:XP_009826018.1 hypothetical protein H257_03566 [Aphanomyces astaci]